MQSGNPFDFYIKCIKNYVTFNGRANRPEYWYFALFNFLISIGLLFVSRIIGTDILRGLYVLFSFLPSIAAGVRRLHDTDRSGWWLLLPIVNIIFLCLPGTLGDNRFGPQPGDDRA